MKISQLRNASAEELKAYLSKEHVSFDQNATRDDLHDIAVKHVKAKVEQGLEAAGVTPTETPEQPLDVPAKVEAPQTFSEEAGEIPKENKYAGMKLEDLMLELRILGFSDRNELQRSIEAYVRERSTLAHEKLALSAERNELDHRALSLDQKAAAMKTDEVKLQKLAREYRFYIDEIRKHKDDRTYIPPSPDQIRGQAEIAVEKSMAEAEQEKENNAKKLEKRNELDRKAAEAAAIAKKAIEDAKKAKAAAAEAARL
jgi:hypothetical protein